jgi:pimeloyl-ACP methyl ester carboxylesterase
MRTGTQPAVSLARRSLSGLLLGALLGCDAVATPAAPSRTGIVLLHGIGGDGNSMKELAGHLRTAGFRVATPDLPFGGPAAFSQPVDAGVRTVQGELERLRREGATRLVLAGFSLGGFFAALVAGRTPVDALVAIAPNGGSDMKPLDDEVARAKQLIAQGRGQQPTLMKDSDVVSPARWDLPAATPAAYVTWFERDGVMNWRRVWSALRPGMPVLLVVPTRDLANLRKVKRETWEMLPPNPANRLYEPRSDHVGAPMASAAEMVRWLRDTLEPGTGAR